jgi:hypothetical protein
VYIFNGLRIYRHTLTEDQCDASVTLGKANHYAVPIGFGHEIIVVPYTHVAPTARGIHLDSEMEEADAQTAKAETPLRRRQNPPSSVHLQGPKDGPRTKSLRGTLQRFLPSNRRARSA